MALPGVSIEVQNGALGQVVATPDGVAGLMLQGVATDDLALATPQQLFSLADAEAVGLTEAYDTTNTCKVWKHIKEFYDEAGSGSELWIILIAKATTMAQMTDKANTHASKLLDAAQGRIRILGVTRSPAGGYSPTLTNGLDADVETAIVNVHALAEEYAEAFKPFRAVLEGYAYTGTPGDLTDLKTLTKNRAAVLIGNTASGSHQAVGLLVGRLANIPVQRNPGRVKDGSLTATAAYLNTTKLEEAGGAPIAIHEKGYITMRQYVGKSGYYFSDDPTAAAATDDYNSLARGRVIDKAITLAYAVYVEEILDEIQVDEEGRINPAKTAYYQAIIDNQINQAMTANLEISGFRSYVNPAQNVLSTGKLTVDLYVTPVGYAKEILVKLGFENPAIS